MSEPRWAQHVTVDDAARLPRAAIADDIHVEQPAAPPGKVRRRRRPLSRRRLLRNALVLAFAFAGLLAVALGLVVVLGAEGHLSEGLDVRTRNGWVLVAGGLGLLIVAGFLPVLFPRRRRSYPHATGPYVAARS